MNKYIILFFFISLIGFSQDSILVKKLLDQAYEYESKNPEKALEIYRKTYKISKDIDDPIGAFKSIMYSGIVKSDLAEYDSALYYYKEALLLSNKTNNIRDKAVTYVNIGNVYQFKGELDSVFNHYLHAIKIFEKIKDSTTISNTYINLAALFQTLDQTDKQIEHLKNAIKTTPKEDKELLGMSYGNLGSAYLEEDNSKLAYHYFNLTDSISKLGVYPRLNFFNTRNFGEYYFYKKSYNKAILFFEDALSTGENINVEYYKNDLLLHLGLAYFELKDITKASYYLKQALEMGVNSNVIEIQEKASFNLSKVYNSINDFKNAYNYYKIHVTLKDSLFDTSKLKMINELETKYQSEKKDKEIAEQQLAIETQELVLQKKNSQYTIMTGLAIFFLVAAILTWFLYQQRQQHKNQEIITLKREQQVKTLESLMEGEEKERLRIAKELHDGVNVELSAIKYKLTSLLEKNNEVVNEVVAMIDKSCQQVRAISHNLVPPSLKNFSLLEAVEDYCSTMNNIHEPNLTFQYIGENINIPKQAEANIFRIVQELVNNSVKHADATEIDVQISNRDNTIQLTVEDNGKGFDKEKVENKGIGLENVRSRVAYLSAKLDFNSDSKGTSYIIDINSDGLT